jgi:hypothetical protein
MRISWGRSPKLIALVICLSFTLLSAVSVQSPHAHASVTPLHKNRLSSPSLLLVSTICGDTHVLRARDGYGANHRCVLFSISRHCHVMLPLLISELWTLRGARVSVSTYQRENFFGYKLAPALDGLFPSVLVKSRQLFIYILCCRKPISGRRRSRSRGATSPQCSGFRCWSHVINLL